MDSVELIRRDLSQDEWEAARQSWREPIQELPGQCPFRGHRLFVIHGPTRQFDFPTLPHGSYTYYAANGQSATRLTRSNKEIRSVLAAEWDELATLDAVLLASLILKFFDAGIKASHHVLANADALRAFGNGTAGDKNYELNEKEFDKALPTIGSTRLNLDGQLLAVRAVTLCGWMHDKQNLGIESFTVGADGSVSFAKRQVLSRRIFARVPAIRY